MEPEDVTSLRHERLLGLGYPEPNEAALIEARAQRVCRFLHSTQN